MTPTNHLPDDLISMLDYFDTEGGIYRPSLFWRSINAIHVAQLKEGGYSSFKRSVALRYFTWIVCPFDPQFKNVLMHWVSHPSLRAIGPNFSVALRQGIPFGWGSGIRSKPFIYKFPFFSLYLLFYRLFVALLRYYVESLDNFQLLERLDEPSEGGPFLMSYNGRLVSQDLCNSILEFLSIAKAVPLPGDIRVAELGAGYGRLAYVFLKAKLCRQYVVIDIPPALYVCQRYLSKVFPNLRVFRFRPFKEYNEIAGEFENADICFLMPNQLELLPAASFDLFVSISSLAEMTKEQVERYILVIDNLARGYVYLKQYPHWHNPMDNLTIARTDYPIPPTWRSVFLRAHPVQSYMFETLYRIRAKNLIA